MLDSPQSAIAELIDINVAIANYEHEWARAAGELKRLIRREERLRREALRQLKGQGTVSERDAEAGFMVGRSDPELYERMEQLEEEVEQYRVQFRAHDRRGSQAQSILAAMRDREAISDYVYPDQ